MKALSKKIASVATTMALSLTMVPAAALATGSAPEQAYAAEGDAADKPHISITAPFSVTFGSKENPYDVNQKPDSISTGSYFYNGGSVGLSVYAVECHEPESYANNKNGSAVVETTGSKPLTDTSQKLFSVWDENSGTDQAIHFGYGHNGNNALDIRKATLDKFIGVGTGKTTNVTYRLNLGNGLSEARVNENSAQKYEEPRTRQDLGTVKFTFGRMAPIGDATLTKAAVNAAGGGDNYQSTLLKGKDVFYLRDNASSQVYSLSQIKNSATQLSDLNAAGNKEKESPFYDMYQEFIESDEGKAYECRTKWTVDESKTYSEENTDYITKEAVSYYRLRILDILNDEYGSGSSLRKAGITFQFKNAYNVLPVVSSRLLVTGTLTADERNTMGYQNTGMYALMTPGVQNNIAMTKAGKTDTSEIYNAIPFPEGTIQPVNKVWNPDRSKNDPKLEACSLFALSASEINGGGLKDYWADSTKWIRGADYPWIYQEGSRIGVDTTGYAFYTRNTTATTFAQKIGLMDYNSSGYSPVENCWDFTRTVGPLQPGAETSTQFFYHAYGKNTDEATNLTNVDWVDDGGPGNRVGLHPAFCF